jgi:predicted transcriptional regulator
LELTPANAAAVADRPVTGALVSDLLSYVMANGRAGQIWVTVQGHANIVAVAVLANLAAVIVADGFQPEEEAVARAEEEGLALFTSPLDPFTLAGRLYEMGLR